MCEDCTTVELAPEEFTEEQVREQTKLAEQVAQLVAAYEATSGIAVGMMIAEYRPEGWRIEVFSRQQELN